MDKEEKEELLAAMGGVVEAKLQLHHSANGYVSKPTFDGAVTVLTQTMGRVTDVVEDVKKGVDEQRRATEDLGEVTGKLRTELAEHKAEHRGVDKAKASARMHAVEVRDEKTSAWRKYGVIVAVVVGGLALLGGFSAWFIGRTEAAMRAANERPPVRVMIDKAAAAEIAKAINNGD